LIDNQKIESHRFSHSTLIKETFVGRELKKGYDLIHVEVLAGFNAPFHKHRYSEEFVYVLKGKLKITLDGCEKGENITIGRGEYILLKNNIEHCLSSLENSEFIIIALPPLQKLAKS
jgi:quercetin dioxygenase-like cupin family protein